MSKIKVLVVEDERIVAKDIQNTLRNLGYEVPAVASTGEEAIRKIAEFRPDIVLMDIVLKGDIDGIEAASRIKTNYKIPVIYLTAYEDEETLDRAKITEPLGYILKPFEERDLHTTLEMSLYKYSMEAKLHESEERYRSLVETSPDGIAIEVDKKVVFVNQSVAKLMGVSDPNRILGRSMLDFIPAENHTSFKEKIKKANDTRSSLPFVEETFVRSDGKKFQAEVAMLPLIHEGKIALQMIIRDITERKKSEEELKRAYNELQKAQKALVYSEKLSALGRFSAGIAHEIRNPLANISASAQFCLSKFNIDDNMKKHFSVILRNTETANRIIKELLDFTSPKETALAPGNIAGVLNHVCELVKTRCAKHKINLIKNIDEKLPQIPLNEKKLEEAFLNFLSNAIEAMPEGGKLVVSTNPPQNNGTIEIIFSDTGIGISKEDSDKIFEPFFTTKDDGTGLGLSLAYHIINSHSGEINFDSIKGKGTTFTIKFPAAD